MEVPTQARRAAKAREHLSRHSRLRGPAEAGSGLRSPPNGSTPRRRQPSVEGHHRRDLRVAILTAGELLSVVTRGAGGIPLVIPGIAKR